MSVRTIILEKIHAFRTRHGLGRSAFGTLAVGDRKFIRDLEAGLPITLRRIEEAEAFMGHYDAQASGKPVVAGGVEEPGEGEAGEDPAGVDDLTGRDVFHAPGSTTDGGRPLREALPPVRCANGGSPR